MNDSSHSIFLSATLRFGRAATKSTFNPPLQLSELVKRLDEMRKTERVKFREKRPLWSCFVLSEPTRAALGYLTNTRAALCLGEEVYPGERDGYFIFWDESDSVIKVDESEAVAGLQAIDAQFHALWAEFPSFTKVKL